MWPRESTKARLKARKGEGRRSLPLYRSGSLRQRRPRDYGLLRFILGVTCVLIALALWLVVETVVRIAGIRRERSATASPTHNS